jgi:hypothetical protein
MEPRYYIGLDVHKRKISYCVKDSSSKVFAEGWIPATRYDLDCWMKNLPQPWTAAMDTLAIFRLVLRLRYARIAEEHIQVFWVDQQRNVFA